MLGYCVPNMLSEIMAFSGEGCCHLLYKSEESQTLQLVVSIRNSDNYN